MVIIYTVIKLMNIKLDVDPVPDTYCISIYTLEIVQRVYELKYYMWCGYKITRLMLEHFLLKKLHNRNVVTLGILPSSIPRPLHVNLSLLEAMLQVIFW